MRISYEDTLELLEDLSLLESAALLAAPGGLRVQWEHAGCRHEIQLPMIMPAVAPDTSLHEFLNSLRQWSPSYLIILIRAGSASLGYYMDGELQAHKVIRKYMVRKSQGRMQISYLNKKGKSRAGSRVRLRESVEFFEEINEKLANWFKEIGEPDRIFYSCPVRLKSPWFSSRVTPPFLNEDQRLISIPHHIHQPDHDELKRVHYLLSSAEISPAE